MESDDLVPKIPRKRSRSPSPPPPVYTDLSPTHNTSQDPTSSPPPPKRQRLTRSQTQAHHQTLQSSPTSANAAPGIASTNPLSRRALKKDVKRARKAARRSARTSRGGGGGMEIDDESGHALEFTFMVDPHSGVVQ